MNQKDAFVEHFRSNWRIRSAEKGVQRELPSRIFRYMHQQYVDQFFKTGILKLSTYESNRSIEDAVRQDEREGTGEYTIISRDRSLQFKLEARAFDYLMLCLSTSADFDKMMARFNVDSCFEITNPTGFGFEVARALQGFRLGCEGRVSYMDGFRQLLLLEQHPQLPDLDRTEQTSERLFPYLDFIGRNSSDMLFTKRQIYKSEEEYRYAWRCAPDHSIFIHCPKALRYCRKAR